MTRKSIEVGDPAPEVTLQLQDGSVRTLSSFLGEQALVLFFYPRDASPICTKEVCEFRDAYEDFVSAGAAVVGVSQDGQESHQKFAKDQRLPFSLASDEDGSLRIAFGVPKTMGIMPGRVTYVIGKDGVVRHVFNSQLSAIRHVQESLSILKALD